MSEQLTLRVIIVDDSSIARASLEELLTGLDPSIRILASLEGPSALWESDVLDTADVVLMDLWMPETTGISVVSKISARCPVVVITGDEPNRVLVDEIIAQGARGFVKKKDLASEAGRQNLLELVRKASSRRPRPGPAGAVPVVALVGSTGAPRALSALMPNLQSISAATLVVQHSPPDSEASVAEWLTRMGVSAHPAEDGEPIRPGVTYVAPSHAHLVVHPPGVLRLEPPVSGDLHVPGGDQLLKSASLFGASLVAVILSGMGNDGANGMKAAAENGATCLVQHPADCAVDGMPRAAMNVSSEVEAVPLRNLGERILHELRRR